MPRQLLSSLRTPLLQLQTRQEHQNSQLHLQPQTQRSQLSMRP